MGNAQAKSAPAQEEHRPHLPHEVLKTLGHFSSGGHVTAETFKHKFGKRLGSALWEHLVEGGKEHISKEELTHHANSLLHVGADWYVRHFMPADRLLRIFFEANGVEEHKEDREFIESLLTQMVALKEPIPFEQSLQAPADDAHRVIEWKNTVCPRFAQTIHDKVVNVLYGRHEPRMSLPSSDILTPVQMLLVQCALPTTVYFPQSNEAEHKAIEWTKLYSSAHQGISINRFETHVFHYKGPSVSIFKLKNGEVSAIASDQEWRHSCNKFGGSHSMLLKIRPTFERIDPTGSTIYCNFKLRSSVFGITFGRHFSVDGEMNDVSDLEAWGCAGAETLEQQRNHKMWLKKQVEKNQKVPLPGNWDENPDKSILEMAGFQFSSERQNDRPDDT
ncbi:Protein Y39A3CL.4 c [Aphelenchoides avenae]|nr:Protein Y39A3CL.4 c [Aphelenchus avenae]